MIRKILVAALATSLALASSAAAFAQDAGKVGVVVKIGGIPWFNAMEAGIKPELSEDRRGRLDESGNPINSDSEGRPS